MSIRISGIEAKKDRIAILATHHVPPNTDRTRRCASLGEAREVDVSEYHDEAVSGWISPHVWDGLGPVADQKWPVDLIATMESACRALRVPAPKLPRWGMPNDLAAMRKLRHDWNTALADTRGSVPTAIETILLPIIRQAFDPVLEESR